MPSNWSAPIYIAMQLKQPGHKMPVKPSSRLALPSEGLLGQKLLFLTVNHVFAREQVGGEGGPALGPGDDLVAEDHEEVEGDAEVAGDEVSVVEFLEPFLTSLVVHKDVKVLEDGDDDAEAKGEVGAPQAKRSHVVHLTLVDALGPSRLDEINVRHQDGDPGQDAEDGDQVDEIIEYFLRIICNVEEGDQGDESRETKSIDGHPAAVGAGEDGERVTLLGKTVQCTGGNVEIAVGGGEDEKQDTGVDEPG